MSEHPPIPDVTRRLAYDEMIKARAAGAELAQLYARTLAVIADSLWREWTRGMAVVPLPEPDGETFDGDPRWQAEIGGDVECYFAEDDGPFVFHDKDMTPTEARDLAVRLLAAADRAEQLVAEQAKAVNTDG